jgi:pimeloyl-ACP methyl ester carboxylesterase
MTGWLTADGKRLEWAHWGPAPAAAPTILLLHEGLGCLALWRDFPAQLAAATGCGVTAFSRAGYGRSDPADLPRPVDYMTHEAVTVLPQVLAATGFRRGLLLGHSDGATIAAEYGGRVADPRLLGLVLMAPHVFTEPEGLAEIARARTAYAGGTLRERLARYHSDPDHSFRGWNDAWLNPAFAGWNVTSALAGIRVPVLAIQGLQDQYGTLAQIAAIEQGSPAPVERLILQPCRHAPHLEQPQAVLAAVAAFCAGLRQRAPTQA